MAATLPVEIDADQDGVVDPGVTPREVRTAFINDLIARRGRKTNGHMPAWFMERWGANLIEPTAFEPDPTSYRHDYYYNAVTNALYKRIVTRHGDITIARWQKVSD
jgi:hypothetical protein